MEYCGSAQVKALCAEFGFRFTKSLGQNFLVSPETVLRIAEASGADRETAVLEIGPGFGALTGALAKRAGKVVAVELDETLFPVLGKTLAGAENVVLVHGDALSVDLAALFDGDPHPRRVAAANLPYCITTKAVLRLLASRLFSRLTVMIQREAADKLICAPGSPNWCRFSLLARYYADIRLLFTVPRSCFYPQPTVESAVLQMTPRPPLPHEEERLFLQLADAAFATRRKALANCLKPLLGAEPAAAVLAACKIEPARRGESLSVSEAETLAAAVRQITQSRAAENADN